MPQIAFDVYMSGETIDTRKLDHSDPDSMARQIVFDDEDEAALQSYINDGAGENILLVPGVLIFNKK